jgi:uncharacterized cupredoxin-like copper-binding protein
MTSLKTWQATYLVCAMVSGPAPAEMEHRMGGLPGMPAHMLKPGSEMEHQQKHHPVQGTDASSMFSFGQPGRPGQASRTVRIDAHDEAHFVPDSLRVAPGETVQFEVRNAGKRSHELRIGNHQYQQEHAEMLKRMPGWEHSSPNSVIVAPGTIATLVWQFGDDPVVELACHVAGSYEAGMLVRVQVAKP